VDKKMNKSTVQSSTSPIKKWNWLTFLLRYGSSILAVTAGFGLRLALESWTDAGLPTFITFYPAVMVVALLAGLGPGLTATVIALIVTTLWIHLPTGEDYSSILIGRVALALFFIMGFFMSTTAELYRRSRRKSALYDLEESTRKIKREMEFLAGLLKNAEQPFVVNYPDGRIGLFNHAYETLTGYRAMELHDMDCFTGLTPVKWLEPEKQKLRELNSTGKPVRYEKEFIRKDGSRVPIELIVHVQRDSEDRPEFYYSFITDLSDRRAVEKALRESENQYRLLFSANPNPMYVFDEETLKFLAVNDAAVTQYGWSRDEFLSMTVLDIRPLEERAQAERTIRSQNGSREVNVGTFRHWRKDGLTMDMEISISSIAFEGRPARLCSLKDITDRRRAEEALLSAMERLHLAQEAARAGSWEWDLVTNENIWSKELFRVYGLEPHSITPSYEAWLSTIHPEDREKASKAIQTAASEGSDIHAEWRVIDQKGEERWLLSHGQPLRDRSGRPVRYIGFVMDITELKGLEKAQEKAFAELQSANEQLRASQAAALNLMEDADRARRKAEEMSASLSVEISEHQRTEEALRASQTSIRKSLREKEVLLKEIHHRVKNNMQVISSMVALHADGMSDPAMRAELQELTNRVRSMAMIHEKLYQSPDLAMVEFSEYTRSLLSYLWRAYGGAASRVRQILELEQILLPVSAAVPCGLILNELVSNSLKHAFAESAGGELTVSLVRSPEGSVRLCVADNGPGLPMAFDWRHSKSLGLRLVQMLAVQLHADIEVTGEKGTKFQVTFKTEVKWTEEKY
jgi:PAS domain S-box-containing protein